MRLAELIDGLAVEHVEGDDGVEVADLAYDSREVGPGTLFFCVRGERSDGHEFAPAAVERGAVALVTERALELGVPRGARRRRARRDGAARRALLGRPELRS